ncbi:MAG TPA: YqgE/AlgH family protein [Candidatus Sulfotelmatobacter sp.]|nr:YqgE/AlgH family protein [Candidatus Sulfotelmatobacter sp.]
MAGMASESSKTSEAYLSGHFLIAMPAMRDPRFARTVIYMCAHNADGAMGLVVNRLIGSLSYNELLKQLGFEGAGDQDDRKVHFGGPVETSRGFVLHSSDKLEEGSLLVDDEVALTSTTDILRSIATGKGPRRSILALGYAGWGPGQLDAELRANSWLSVSADPELLFDLDLESKWARAMAKIGVGLGMLSGEAGHA